MEELSWLLRNGYTVSRPNLECKNTKILKYNGNSVGVFYSKESLLNFCKTLLR